MDRAASWLALAVGVAAGCGFDSSSASGPGGDGSPIDAAGGVVDGGGTVDGGGGEIDADVPVSAFCQGGPALEACYELDGTLEDSTENDNDLTGSNFDFTASDSGMALVTSQSSKMDAIESPSLDFTDQLTIEAYLMPSGPQDRWAIDHDAQWGLRLDGDRAVCTVITLDEESAPSTSTLLSAPGTVPDNQWTHVACTYDGTTFTLYVDGAVATTPELVTGPIDTSPNGGFTVGRDAPGGSSWLGRIDSVRIWSTARTENQILDSL